MIVLSPRQKAVYDFLWDVTSGGTVPWTGWIRLDGICRQTMNASIAMLETLGAISVSKISNLQPRTYRVLVDSTEVMAADLSTVMGARDKRWDGRFDLPVRPDSGAFMRRLAEVHKGRAP